MFLVFKIKFYTYVTWLVSMGMCSTKGLISYFSDIIILGLSL